MTGYVKIPTHIPALSSVGELRSAVPKVAQLPTSRIMEMVSFDVTPSPGRATTHCTVYTRFS